MSCKHSADSIKHENIDDYISRFKIVGTRFVLFRDLPQLISEHVQGNIALDYGCGPAQSTLHLKSLGLNVHGVDISDRAIECARQEDPEGKYILIKSGELPQEDNCYDLVFASAVFGHTNTKKEILDNFKEIARVLKVGGTFILMEFDKQTYSHCNFLSFHTMFEENKNLTSGCQVKIQFKDCNRVGVHIFWSDEDYINCIKAAGLEVVKTHIPLGNDSDGYEWLDEKYLSSSTIYIARKTQNPKC